METSNIIDNRLPILLIVHEKRPRSLHVTESTDFYPFGLVIEGTRYVDESRVVNSYGYQGMFSEFDVRTGWNRFALRGNYDSRLGRWQSGDPYAQFVSPYIGMGNSAINGADSDGGFWPGIDIFFRMFMDPVFQSWMMGSTFLEPVTVSATRLPSGGGALLGPLAPFVMSIIAIGSELAVLAPSGDLGRSAPNLYNNQTNIQSLPNPPHSQGPPSPINFVQYEGRPLYSIDYAVNKINNVSYPNYDGADAAGYGASCAKFIRWSLEAGFRVRDNALKGRLPVPARLYGPYLMSMGFTPMNTQAGYLKGDIAVLEGYPGGTADDNGVPYGHIQMFNGEQWVSSWKQSRPFWPGKDYAAEKPNFQIYRWLGTR